MVSKKNPSEDGAFRETNASGLLKDYQILSREYDKILKISQEILTELTKDKDVARLSRLLDQKSDIGRNIGLLSHNLSGRNIKFSPSEKSWLNQAKRELQKIKSKADQLWNLENRIIKLTEDC